MSSKTSGLAATLGGGVISALLCVLLTQVTRGLPPDLVEWLLTAAPAALHPLIEELRHGFSHDLNSDDMPTAVFLAIQAALWVVMCLTSWQILRRPDQPAVLLAMLGFSLLFRLILIPAVPVHSHEVYRYLWDGRTTLSGINPYLYEPAALVMQQSGIDKPTEIQGKLYQGRSWSTSDQARLASLSELRDAAPALHDNITDPHLPSAAPPFAQACFAAAAFLTGGSLLGFKALITLFDLGVIILLLRLLRRLGLRRSGVIFYAWSPLILLSFPISARWEAVPIFIFLCAVSLAMRRKTWQGSAVLAVAALSHPGWLAQTPVLYRPTWRHLLAWFLVFLLTASAFAPFVWWQDAGLAPILNAFRWTESAEPALPGLFLGVERLCAGILASPEESSFLALLFCSFLFLVFLSWQSFRPTPDHQSVMRHGFGVAAALFLLSPSASPGQIIWITPFLCAFPRPSWIVLMLTIQATFLQFHTDYGQFGSLLGLIPWLNLAVWGSFFLFCALDPLLLRLIRAPVSTSDPALPL